MSLPRPHTPYFLVKLPRKKIDKVGSIFIPETAKYMAFNLQCGEVVDIGSGAAKYFPEVQIGHTLIFHHFCESSSEEEARVDHLILSTDTHNYYVITAYEHNGKDCETYGVWDGEKIIPNKDYIFLHPKLSNKKNIQEQTIDDALTSNQLSVTQSGLLVFNDWEDSREEKERRMDMMKKEIEDLSKSGINKAHVQKGIAEKEFDMNKISADINKKKYLPFKIAFYNSEILKYFKGRKSITDTELVYVLNIASSTEITFNNINYIVAKVKYVGLIN